jgi:hypothetical protein
MEYTGWCQNEFNVQGYLRRRGRRHYLPPRQLGLLRGGEGWRLQYAAQRSVSYTNLLNLVKDS